MFQDSGGTWFSPKRLMSSLSTLASNVLSGEENNQGSPASNAPNATYSNPSGYPPHPSPTGPVSDSFIQRFDNVLAHELGEDQQRSAVPSYQHIDRSWGHAPPLSQQPAPGYDSSAPYSGYQDSHSPLSSLPLPRNPSRPTSRRNSLSGSSPRYPSPLEPHMPDNRGQPESYASVLSPTHPIQPRPVATPSSSSAPFIPSPSHPAYPPVTTDPTSPAQSLLHLQVSPPSAPALFSPSQPVQPLQPLPVQAVSPYSGIAATSSVPTPASTLSPSTISAPPSTSHHSPGRTVRALHLGQHVPQSSKSAATTPTSAAPGAFPWTQSSQPLQPPQPLQSLQPQPQQSMTPTYPPSSSSYPPWQSNPSPAGAPSPSAAVPVSVPVPDVMSRMQSPPPPSRSYNPLSPAVTAPSHPSDYNPHMDPTTPVFPSASAAAPTSYADPYAAYASPSMPAPAPAPSAPGLPPPPPPAASNYWLKKAEEAKAQKEASGDGLDVPRVDYSDLDYTTMDLRYEGSGQKLLLKKATIAPTTNASVNFSERMAAAGYQGVNGVVPPADYQPGRAYHFSGTAPVHGYVFPSSAGPAPPASSASSVPPTAVPTSTSPSQAQTFAGYPEAQAQYAQPPVYNPYS